MPNKENQITVCIIDTAHATYYIDEDTDTKLFYLSQDEVSKGVFNSKQDAILHVITKLNLSYYNSIKLEKQTVGGGE